VKGFKQRSCNFIFYFVQKKIHFWLTSLKTNLQTIKHQEHHHQQEHCILRKRKKSLTTHTEKPRKSSSTKKSRKSLYYEKDQTEKPRNEIYLLPSFFTIQIHLLPSPYNTHTFKTEKSKRIELNSNNTLFIFLKPQPPPQTHKP
jgi:hypothetical protein